MFRPEKEDAAMPFTLAHPAAIVPIARGRSVTSALVMGSMAGGPGFASSRSGRPIGWQLSRVTSSGRGSIDRPWPGAPPSSLSLLPTLRHSIDVQAKTGFAPETLTAIAAGEVAR